LFIGYTISIANGNNIEIYKKNNRDEFFLINGTGYTATVTCTKLGSTIGVEIQYTFTLKEKKGTFCGTI